MLIWLTESKGGVGNGFGEVGKLTDKGLSEWEDEEKNSCLLNAFYVLSTRLDI